MFTYPDRCQCLTHKGKNIFLMDFSNLDPAGSLKIIDESIKFISTQPAKSIMTLSDITNGSFNQDVTEAFKKLAKANKPYVIAAAIVGVSGMKKIIFDAVRVFSGRQNMKSHASREEALEWLVTYSE